MLDLRYWFAPCVCINVFSWVCVKYITSSELSEQEIINKLSRSVWYATMVYNNSAVWVNNSQLKVWLPCHLKYLIGFSRYMEKTCNLRLLYLLCYISICVQDDQNWFQIKQMDHKQQCKAFMTVNLTSGSKILPLKTRKFSTNTQKTRCRPTHYNLLASTEWKMNTSCKKVRKCFPRCCTSSPNRDIMRLQLN